MTRYILTALVALVLLADTVQAGCPIPVPVSDNTARSRAREASRLFDDALRDHNRHLDIHERAAISAGSLQRHSAALAHRPAGPAYRQRLSLAGADASVISPAAADLGVPQIPVLTSPDPSSLFGAILAGLIDKLLSHLHPALRAAAQGMLATAAPGTALSMPPRHTTIPARQRMRHSNWKVPTSRGTATLSGPEAIHYLNHRSAGLHHPDDEAILFHDDGTTCCFLV